MTNCPVNQPVGKNQSHDEPVAVKHQCQWSLKSSSSATRAWTLQWVPWKRRLSCAKTMCQTRSIFFRGEALLKCTFLVAGQCGKIEGSGCIWMEMLIDWRTAKMQCLQCANEWELEHKAMEADLPQQSPISYSNTFHCLVILLCRNSNLGICNNKSIFPSHSILGLNSSPLQSQGSSPCASFSDDFSPSFTPCFPSFTALRVLTVTPFSQLPMARGANRAAMAGFGWKAEVSMERNPAPKWRTLEMGEELGHQWPFQEPIYWRYLPFLRPM